MLSFSKLYRFIVEGNMHKSECEWAKYNQREPSSLHGVFGYAINNNISNFNITSGLFKNSQFRAINPVKLGCKINKNPGIFRTDPLRFKLVPQDKKNENFNLEGFEEIIHFVRRNNMLSLNELFKKFPVSELYRFIVDGNMHKSERGWVNYARREPGSLPGAFDAFGYAISNNMSNFNITPDLIKNIHFRVITPVKYNYKKTIIVPGQFRTEPVRFELISEDKIKGNCNPEGLEELMHFVKSHRSDGCMIHRNQPAVAHTKSDKKSSSITLPPESLYGAEDISELTNYITLQESDWLYFRPPCAERLEALIVMVCERYNLEIKMATLDEEKLCVIVACVQTLERIHPFRDGNIRTFYILLNRLLMQNGFLPTMMADPNHLDGFNLQAVIEEVKQGIEFTRLLIQNPKTILFDYETKIITPKDIYPAYDYLAPELTDPIDDCIDGYYSAEKKLSECIQDLPEYWSTEEKSSDAAFSPGFFKQKSSLDFDKDSKMEDFEGCETSAHCLMKN